MKKVVEVVLHLLFWFVFLLLVPYVSYISLTKLYDAPWASFWEYMAPFYRPSYIKELSLYMVVFYVFYFIGSYALHKTIMIRSILYLGWSFLIVIPMVMILLGTHDYVVHHVLTTYYFIIASTGGLLFSVVKGIILWLLAISEKKALQKRQLESENALLLLKAQLNPHFLFNSLNNIDILIEESPKIASDYLKKLSDILRYVLYETKEDETTLAREMEQISNYIELQKIRTANTSYVHFEVIGTVGDQKIVPMIFLPFIENAFKFSKNKFKEHAISIRFEIEPKSIQMTCRNYYEEHHLHILKNEGLGIETIRQRLRLLYPGKHDLEIENAENWFTVTLNIQLEHGH